MDLELEQFLGKADFSSREKIRSNLEGLWPYDFSAVEAIVWIICNVQKLPDEAFPAFAEFIRNNAGGECTQLRDIVRSSANYGKNNARYRALTVLFFIDPSNCQDVNLTILNASTLEMLIAALHVAMKQGLVQSLEAMVGRGKELLEEEPDLRDSKSPHNGFLFQITLAIRMIVVNKMLELEEFLPVAHFLFLCLTIGKRLPVGVAGNATISLLNMYKLGRYSFRVADTLRQVFKSRDRGFLLPFLAVFLWLAQLPILASSRWAAIGINFLLGL